MTDPVTATNDAGTEPSFDRDAIRSRILDAALWHVPFDGWTPATLALGARDAGLDSVAAQRVFPGGPVDAIRFWSERTDRQTVDACSQPGFAQRRVREKVRLLVRTRLELVAPHKEAVRHALGVLAVPIHGALAAKLLARTVDAIWYAAGDTATDFNWYTKRGLLAGVYGATLPHWPEDRSPDHVDSRSFLDRRLDEVLRFPRVLADIGNWVAPFVPAFMRPPHSSGRSSA